MAKRIRNNPEGQVKGPGTATSDSILARVSNGEYVLPKAAVDYFGKENLDRLLQALAANKPPRFGFGGAVDDAAAQVAMADSAAQSQAAAGQVQQADNAISALQGLREAQAGALNAASGGNNFSANVDKSAAPASSAAQGPAPSSGGLNAMAPTATAQSAYSQARAGADPLDLASGRFDATTKPPTTNGQGPNPSAVQALDQAVAKADSLDLASGRFGRENSSLISAATEPSSGGLPAALRLPAILRRLSPPPSPSPPPPPPSKNFLDVEAERRERDQRAGLYSPPRFKDGGAVEEFSPFTMFAVPPSDSKPVFAPPVTPPAAQPVTPPPSLGAPVPQQPPQSLNQLAPQPPVAKPLNFANGNNYTNFSDEGPTPPRFTGDSVPDFATARGGYVGARTDAEAARSLRDRATQSQNAQFMINEYNRATDALRDLRAEKMGVSRSMLDQLEGRPGSGSGNGLQMMAPQMPKFEMPGLWDRPGDSFGDAGMRQAKYEGLLSDIQSIKGFGSKHRRAALVQLAQAMVQPGMAQQQAAVNAYNAQLGAQTEYAKSLNDLYARQVMTPYQQGRLAIDREKNTIEGRKIDALADKQGTKKLEDLASDLSKDPRYSNYAKAKNYMGMLENQFNSMNPADHARMSLTVQQLARPESEPNDYTTKVLEGSTRDIVDTVFGPVKQAFGGSAYSQSQRERLLNTGKGSFEAKQAEGFAAIDDAVNRIVAAGGDPRQYLNPGDLQFWQARKQGAQGGSGVDYHYVNGKLVAPQ